MLRVDEPFNIVATSPRNREFFAVRELESALNDLGDSEARVWKSGISGVILAKTSLNQYEIPYRMRELVKENPWSFRDVKRVIPIEFNVKTDLNEFRTVGETLRDRIPSGKTYKIEVKRRYTSLDRMEIINSIAEVINRKVDLKNPDYIIIVEILGPVSGMSLINPDGILSIEKELLDF